MTHLTYDGVIKSRKQWIRYLDYPKPIKILLSIYILGFAIWTTTHTMDLINHGFILNENVPFWKNIYWTSLIFFDFLAIILILRNIVPALLISNLIIISDVIINTDGFTFERWGYPDDYKVILQIIFCVYIVITTPIILKEYKTNMIRK